MPDDKRRDYPNLIVKDGTMSGSFDAEMKMREADAKRRRRHQDIQQKMSAHRYGPGQMARLGSHRMVTPDAPRLVLHYRKGGYDCVSEVTMVPHPGRPGKMEMMFTLVCPRCIRDKKLAEGQSQLMVRNSHRKFWIDDRPENKMPKMVNFFGTQQQVLPAGLVTVKDVIRCSNVGCGWAAKITDSIVDEVA